MSVKIVIISWIVLLAIIFILVISNKVLKNKLAASLGPYGSWLSQL